MLLCVLKWSTAMRAWRQQSRCVLELACSCLPAGALNHLQASGHITLPVLEIMHKQEYHKEPTVCRQDDSIVGFCG